MKRLVTTAILLLQSVAFGCATSTAAGTYESPSYSSDDITARFPGVQNRPTDRDRGFAVCLSLAGVPGLGAAYLGHPVRGAFNAATYFGSGGVIYASIINEANGQPTPALKTVDLQQ